MNFLEEAVSLNNHGASLLYSGNLLQALRHLRDALRKVKEACSHDDVASPGLDIDSWKSFVRVLTDDETSCKKDESFLWTLPLLIDSLKVEDERKYDLQLFNAVLLFNMALAFHMKKDEPSLLKAAKLYELSIESSKSAMDQDCGYLVVLPAMNNLAQIQFDQQRFDSASDISDELADVAAFCRTSRRGDSMGFLEADLERMLLNAILMETPQAAASA